MGLLGNLGRLDIVRSDFDRGAFEAPAREEQGSLGRRFLVTIMVVVSALLSIRMESCEKRGAADGWMGEGRSRTFANEMSAFPSLGPSMPAILPQNLSYPRCQSVHHRSRCGDAAVGASEWGPGEGERD